MNCNICGESVEEHRDGLMCCPCCAGPARLFHDQSGDYCAECARWGDSKGKDESCNLSTGVHRSAALAVAEWNRRARADNARLREALALALTVCEESLPYLVRWCEESLPSDAWYPERVQADYERARALADSQQQGVIDEK